MFFPLADARLQDRDGLTPTPASAIQPSALSFGSYRATMAAFQSGQQHVASALGCGATRRLLQDQGACAAGQVFCWCVVGAVGARRQWRVGGSSSVF